MRRDQIGLVEHDDIAELDLVDQKVDHRAVVVLAQALSPIADVIGRCQITQEVERVDHGHHGVEPGDLAERHAVFVFEGEGLGDRQRLGDARALDEQVVEAA
jgi:hypothetical protein